ncbi:MAG: DVU_1551 family NTP transferase, partial [Peptococcales bacterium]
AAGIADIRVIVGYRAEDLLPVLSSLGVTPVLNDNYDQGMFSSVVCGLNTFTGDVDGFFLLPGDMPLVKKTTFKKLINKYQETNYSVIYPCFQGKRGHPPLITRRCFKAILAQGMDGNLRNILQKFNHEAYELAVIDQGILLDMDTPGDYQRVVELAKRGSIPTLEECQALFDLHKVSETIIRHGQKVAQIAEFLAQALIERGFSLDLELIRASALLHDIAKGGPSHARRGADILLSEGFPSVAKVIIEHMDLEFELDEIDFLLDEKKIIYFTDKLVQGENLISCEERFRNASYKYGCTWEVIEKIEKRKKNALIIERKIKDYLQVDDLFSYIYEKAAQRSYNDV